MKTSEMQNGARTLPSNKKILTAKKITGLTRKAEQRSRLKYAAGTALFDYTNDKTLTDLTLLDGEDFVETR
ncbi:MAG: hypothetical protein LBK66_03450 [Spirochaetaceae bacterium]|jgi:hypothetical protein|nr:hypothetical protein [Spirochaetaceae bacterium]